MSSMCAGWGKYTNESEWKVGWVRIMLQVYTFVAYVGATWKHK